MFYDKKKSEEQRKRKMSTEVTIITPGCHFSGTLCCKGTVRIGGKVDGSIVSEGILIVEEGAEVMAKIQADEVVVRGILNGSIDARVRVEFHKTADYKGEIKTQSLIITEGAKVNGKTTMPPESKKEDAKNDQKTSKMRPVPEISANETSL